MNKDIEEIKLFIAKLIKENKETDIIYAQYLESLLMQKKPSKQKLGSLDFNKKIYKFHTLIVGSLTKHLGLEKVDSDYILYLTNLNLISRKTLIQWDEIAR